MCGCICPSCKTPLIARHGEVKEWHFAHASRAVYSKTERECNYSFYLSVRMMARQIIGREIEIVLPEYKDSVSEYLPQYEDFINETFMITVKQKIILTNVQVEYNFMGTSVDVFGGVGEFYFIIYFTHPGRDIPQTLFNPYNSKCGIVSVSLTRLPLLFRSAQNSKGTYHEILRDFLVNNTSLKKWVFHPRYKRCQQEAKNKLEKQKAKLTQARRLKNEVEYNLITSTPASKNGIINKPFDAMPKRLAEYECIMCHTTWQDWESSGSVCPKCNTHLYRTIKRYIDSET